MRRSAVAVAGVALGAAALFTSLAGANTPVLTLPSPPVVYTAGSNAVVDYTATADDGGTPVDSRAATPPPARRSRGA